MTSVELSRRKSIVSCGIGGGQGGGCDSPKRKSEEGSSFDANPLKKAKSIPQLPQLSYAGKSALSTQTRNYSTPQLTTSSNTKLSVSTQQTKPQNTSASSSSSSSLIHTSPVVFLRTRVSGRTPEDDKVHSTFFSKPGQPEMEAYDNDVISAIRNRDIETLRQMKKNGRSLNACNRFGESLLHMACRRGFSDVVQFLVTEGEARITVKDDYGRTPLHDACWTPEPNYEVMEVLLSVIDPSMLLTEDVRGHTPFDYSRREHWGSWVEYLKRKIPESPQ